MTNEEFESTLLPKKLSFRLVEACRLVLVHEVSEESAAKAAGIDGGNTKSFKEALTMFKKGH